MSFRCLMKVETTIWKREPYTITMRQIEDNSNILTETTVDLTQTKKTSLVVDVSGLEWKEKVKIIKKVLDENGVISNEINFVKSVCRKETPHSPDNFMVAVKLENETIYEANGKFSVKRLIEKL